MKNTVFVTGVGMVGPCGNSAGAFWEGLLSGRNYMTPLQLEGTAGAAPPFAGQVSGMEPERVISKRLLKKCSRFSVMSILAAKDAMDDAHWELDQMSRERIGIFVGNNSGAGRVRGMACVSCTPKGHPSLTQIWRATGSLRRHKGICPWPSTSRATARR